MPLSISSGPSSATESLALSLSDWSLADLISRADALTQQGQLLPAIELYRAWLSGRKDPLQYVALFNLGTLLGSAKQYPLAEQACRAALQLKPDLFQARLNLGHQLENQGQLEEAINEWKQVLIQLEGTPNPDITLHLHALNNLARSLETARRYDEAEAHLVRSLQVEPEQSAVLSHYVHIRQKQCKWPVYHAFADITLNQQLTATSALAMLAAYDDPALQLMAAREFVHTKVKLPVPRKTGRTRAADDRIKIGYLSGDLCMHAVGLLTVELFELHDRTQFEVFAFCWSREDGSPLRQRLVRAFDHYFRIGDLDDTSAAQLIEAQGIDILVDLQGLTSGARPNILMQRPARVQVSYLGLPGTSGLPTVDYILADPFVFPQELEPFMTEKPLYVPRCYQVSDRQRVVGPDLTRARCGLPDDKFVFASFNNNYKFTQEVFSCWMRILQQVPNSVLWLLSDNSWAEKNMQNQARAQGVDPARLVFSGRATPTEYLARLKLPDLFLDTLPYNAGTTANDVLWMGTPILTCSGRTYISRMCGSLLTAVGLPDLITYSLSEYENKAIQLGRNSRMISTYKRYLSENRLTSDLFDLPELVKDIEQALNRIAR
jgi:predicted O-linked N-acetylglucosamine transferase (SPINDLY family)